MDRKFTGRMRPIGISLFLFFLVMSFQNCGVVKFEESASKRAGFTFPTEGCSQDSFTQPQYQFAQKVDLLIMTDTSSSLDAERREVAQEIDRFVEKLPQGSDFQIAVMLGHLDPAAGQPDWVGRIFQAGNEPHVLASRSLPLGAIRAHLLQKLTSVVSDRYGTAGGESGFISLTRALGDRLSEARAHGFFRSDAALAVIFVSDENDICVPEANPLAYEVDMYNAHCDPTVHNHLTLYRSLLNQVGENPLALGAIIHTQASEVTGSADGVGLGYLELVQQNRGVLAPISHTNGIADGISRIGELLAARLNLITERRLYKYMEGHQIRVVVNGELAPSNSFEVNPLVPSIRLLDPSATGSANSAVQILNCEPWVDLEE